MDAVVSRDALTAGQHRAARAMLDWSLVEASRRAKVSIAAIVAIEKDTGTSFEKCRSAMADAYEAAGVRFHDWGVAGRGVTLGPPTMPDLSSSSP